MTQKSCPVCRRQTLKEIELEARLAASHCSQCDGVWLSANDYLAWLKTVPQGDPAAAPDPVPLDDKQAKLCPDDGRFLRRYQIWPDVDFYLDRCQTCNGIWFDGQEWQGLKANNLHSRVNTFFTKTWQTQLRAEEVRHRLDAMYRERFGAADYAKIKEIRQWLTAHPQSASLIAFLTDRGPYQIS